MDTFSNTSQSPHYIGTSGYPPPPQQRRLHPPAGPPWQFPHPQQWNNTSFPPQASPFDHGPFGPPPPRGPFHRVMWIIWNLPVTAFIQIHSFSELADFNRTYFNLDLNHLILFKVSVIYMKKVIFLFVKQNCKKDNKKPVA